LYKLRLKLNDEKIGQFLYLLWDPTKNETTYLLIVENIFGVCPFFHRLYNNRHTTSVKKIGYCLRNCLLSAAFLCPAKFFGALANKMDKVEGDIKSTVTSSLSLAYKGGATLKVKKLRKETFLSLQIDDDEKANKKAFKKVMKSFEEEGTISVDR